MPESQSEQSEQSQRAQQSQQSQSETEALLRALRALPDPRPSGPEDVAALLAGARSVAGRWADVLDEIREGAHGFVGPRAAAALELAFRRAEESYVELEIALGDVIRAGVRPPDSPV
ncbi:hypothetical protein [Streptomyces sp. TRM64462]|uniref:hypothetical protein n=1 Tax=Streptomyces sp. TRM64462 TaxID=2741726 RepID=UPI0028159815|nr:hypothetical protein [Streptomyces sp. TRM64462]